MMRNQRTITLCLNSKLGERRKEEKGKREGKGRGGIRRKSLSCLLREGREKKEK